MTDRLSLLPALALAALLLAVPAAGQEPEVAELRFEGARSFTHAELSAAIMTRQTRCRNLLLEVVCWMGLGQEPAHLAHGALEADAFRLKVYYYERGFRQAEVTVDTTRVRDDAVGLTFRIQEGRPVRIAQVEIAGAPGSLSTRGLPVAPGAPFDVVAYEATRDTLLSRLRDGGYGEAQVLVGYTIDREDPHAATLQYEVVPGQRLRFGDIRVDGTEAVSPELVHRMLAFEEGDRYSLSAILRSQRNLYGLQIFRHAIVEAEFEAVTDSLVPVRVRVAEGDMRRVRAGAGVNNVECGTVDGRWTSRNFMGNGRRLSLTARLGNLLIDDCGPLVDDASTVFQELTGVLSVDFVQPWFFGPRNNVGAGLFAERRNVPGVFVRSAAGGYLSVGRSLGENAALTLAYRPELTELATHQGGDLFFCVNFVGCTFQDVAVLRDPHFLSPVTLSASVDRTDALFSPSRGFIARADLEHAGSYTFSDFAYTRLQGEASGYLGERGGVVLATRVRGGIGWAHAGGAGSETLGLNPQKRFFAGGPNSVRGFDQYRLGPTVLGIDAVPYLVDVDDDPRTERVEGLVGCTAEEVNDLTCDVTALARAQPSLFEERPAGGEVLLEGNVELRFPFPRGGGRLRGAAFVDVGQVWRTRGDVTLRDLVATPGVGIRYHSPIGPIRVDAAFNPRAPQELRVLTTRVQSCQLDQPGCRKVGDQPKEALRNTDTVAPLMQAVPFGSDLGEIDSLGDFFGRLNLQFSIGQAF